MAVKPRAKAAAETRAGASANVEASKPPRFHVPTMATLSSDLRTLFINVCILGAFIILIPVIGSQFVRTQVIIEPIAVPLALMQRGMSADVAANRLWDGLQAAQTEAATSKAGISAIPNSQRVDFSIPDSGISIDSLVYYVRQFFHAYQTRISGELRCEDVQCTPAGISLRVRVFRDKLSVIQLPPLGTGPEDTYFRNAAIEVLKVLDPFTASAAEADTNPAAAMAMARKLILQQHPDAKWAHNLIGNLKQQKGDATGAVAEFRAALALDPNFLVAKTNLGTALVATNDLKGAAQVFDEVAKVDPEGKFLLVGRSRLAVASGKIDDAVNDLLEADKRDPGTPIYFLLAAQDEYDAKQYDKTAEFANRALEVDPGSAAGLSLLAVVYLMADTPDKAVAAYGRAVDYAPDDASLQAGYGDVLLVDHKFDDALKHIERAIALAPSEVGYQRSRAQILYALSRYDDAIAQLDALRKLDPSGPDYASDYGENYAGLGRDDDAMKAFTSVVASRPGTPEADMAAAEIKFLQIKAKSAASAATPAPAATAPAPAVPAPSAPAAPPATSPATASTPAAPAAPAASP